jgi:peptidoglycan/LPS O-acetylase OafA/YrhL
MEMHEHSRLFELDGLRGIAALAVCIFHFDLFNYGVTGVDLFFMISGFVIYMSIVNAKTIQDFWFSRLTRLYPLYWFSIVIAIIGFTLFTNQIIEHDKRFVIGNLTMLQPIFRSKNLVQVYWTLYVELNFYVLISVLWHLKKLDKIELIVCAIMLIFTAIIVIYQLSNDQSPVYTRFFIVFRGLVPLISHFQMFAAGIIFYLIYTKGYSLFRLIILSFSFVLIAITHKIGGRVFYFLNNGEHLCCCFIYYALFILIIHKKALFLKSSILVELGTISYALYLIHQSLGQPISDYLSLSLNLALSKTIGISISLIVAFFITHYFDIPLRKRLTKAYNLQIKNSITIQ